MSRLSLCTLLLLPACCPPFFLGGGSSGGGRGNSSGGGSTGGRTCQTDQDCAATLGKGNCSDGTCVICSTSATCATGLTCVAGTCRFVPSDAGPTPTPCFRSCDCPAPQGCVGQLCAATPDPCGVDNQCGCGTICGPQGTCIAPCKTNSDCVPPLQFCYLPGGHCGGCQNSFQCSAGQFCVLGLCSADDAGCGGQCCNNGDCPQSAPLCELDDAGTGNRCSGCRSFHDCAGPEACVDGGCVIGGYPACDAGCSGELVCNEDAGACQPACCDPACTPPAICDPVACTCNCNACGGLCPSGTSCDTDTCACLPQAPPADDGGAGCGGVLGTCTCAFCAGCPTGKTCICPFGDVCSLTSSCWASGGVGFCQ